MNKQQRIVVWVLASVLSAICIVHGVVRQGYLMSEPSFVLAWRRDSFLWVFLFPVLLMGISTFLHFMRRKD
jgi:hypothetical protein